MYENRPVKNNKGRMFLFKKPYKLKLKLNKNIKAKVKRAAITPPLEPTTNIAKAKKVAKRHEIMILLFLVRKANAIHDINKIRVTTLGPDQGISPRNSE